MEMNGMELNSTCNLIFVELFSPSRFQFQFRFLDSVGGIQMPDRRLD